MNMNQIPSELQKGLYPKFKGYIISKFHSCKVQIHTFPKVGILLELQEQKKIQRHSWIHSWNLQISILQVQAPLCLLQKFSCDMKKET